MEDGGLHLPLLSEEPPPLPDDLPPPIPDDSLPESVLVDLSAASQLNLSSLSAAVFPGEATPEAGFRDREISAAAHQRNRESDRSVVCNPEGDHRAARLDLSVPRKASDLCSPATALPADREAPRIRDRKRSQPDHKKGRHDLKRCFVQPGEAASSRARDLLRRTVIVENLSPFTGEAAVRKGLSQLGNVNRVELFRNPLQPGHLSMEWAAVEMASVENAENAIQTARQNIFLLGAVPRPVTIRAAVERDHIFGAGSSSSKTMPKIIECYSSEFEDLSKLRNLHYQHFTEETLLDRLQMKDAKALHNAQLNRLVDILETNDVLTGFQLQQEIANYRSFFSGV